MQDATSFRVDNCLPECNSDLMRLLFAGLISLATATSAAAQPATFLVFFDWNQATLTAQGHQIVHQAADIALHTRSPVIVNGFTDTSGTAGYNNALSWRRVQAVTAELQADGVPLGAVHAQGYGEAYLRLPTPNDVREPQNRRVQITIQQPVVMAPPPPPPPIPYYPAPFVGFGVGIFPRWGCCWGGFHGGWGGHWH